VSKIGGRDIFGLGMVLLLLLGAWHVARGNGASCEETRHPRGRVWERVLRGDVRYPRVGRRHAIGCHEGVVDALIARCTRRRWLSAERHLAGSREKEGSEEELHDWGQPAARPVAAFAAACV
jgi:hypothetical protein